MKSPICFLLAFFLFTQTIFAAVYSYNITSAILELNGIYIAGMIRDLFINQVPAFIGLIVLINTISLIKFVTNEELVDLAGRLPGKLIFLGFAWLSILVSAGSNPDADGYYDIVGGAVQKRFGDAVDGRQMAVKPLSALNSGVLELADLIARSIYELIQENIVGEGSVPLIMQRAVAEAMNINTMNPYDVDSVRIYSAYCNESFTKSDFAKNNDVSFRDTIGEYLKEGTVEGADIKEALQKLWIPHLNARGKEKLASGVDKNMLYNSTYCYTCYDLKVNVDAQIDRLFKDPESFVNKLTTQDSELEGIGEEDLKLVYQIVLDKELNTVINASKNELIKPGEFDRPEIGDSANRGMTYWSQLKAEIAESDTFGLKTATEELYSFLHTMPTYFGLISAFFIIAAEICLFLTVIYANMSMVQLCIKTWVGYLILKCLPAIWLYLESVLKSFYHLKMSHLSSTTFYATDVTTEISSYLRGIQSGCIYAMVGSFIMVVPFIPGISEGAKWMISKR
jgi:hypothetical protein